MKTSKKQEKVDSWLGAIVIAIIVSIILAIVG